MPRANVFIHTELLTAYQQGLQANYVIKTTDEIVYSFYCDSTSNIYYRKSTSRGLTWGDAVLVKSGTTAFHMLAVWFDKWTPGDSGTVIHIAYTETTNDDVIYRSLDTASDTLGSEVVVFAGASTSGTNICLSITKARGGNLLVAFDIDGGTEKGFYRSTDNGATFGARSDMTEGGDYFLLAPGFAADNQDVLCIFWDRSASEISRKVYDDSADSWAETSISAGMTSVAAGTATAQFALAVDPTNSRLFVVAWTNRDTANADLLAWIVSESAITALTDVVTNSTDDQSNCTICRDSNSGKLTVFYAGKSDGSETIGTAVNIYSKESDDNGTTWSAEKQITTTARNYTGLFSCPVTAGWVPFQVIVTPSVGTRYQMMNLVIPTQRTQVVLGLG